MNVLNWFLENQETLLNWIVKPLFGFIIGYLAKQFLRNLKLAPGNANSQFHKKLKLYLRKKKKIFKKHSISRWWVKKLLELMEIGKICDLEDNQIINYMINEFDKLLKMIFERLNDYLKVKYAGSHPKIMSFDVQVLREILKDFFNKFRSDLFRFFM